MSNVVELNIQKKLPATARARELAFLIDLIIVYIVRSIYGHFVLKYSLQDKFINFVREIKEKFGILEKLQKEQVVYFLEHQFYKECMWFIGGAFLVSVLYNFVCFLWKMASIGQVVMKVHVISSNGKNANIFQLFARSIAIVFPWFALFLLLVQSFLSQYGIIYINGTLFTLFVFVIMFWYDIIFLNKERIIGHDFLTGTRMIFDDPNRNETIIERFIPNPSKTLNGISKGLKDTFKKARDIIKK
ncbi:MAG: RDD family protein [Rickettsiales bacterium]|jgi:uncharacterized RDD family membrane protein YckC|nr:RDD family protein [Rickettsiales bacterium]